MGSVPAFSQFVARWMHGECGVLASGEQLTILSQRRLQLSVAPGWLR